LQLMTWSSSDDGYKMTRVQGMSPREQGTAKTPILTDVSDPPCAQQVAQNCHNGTQNDNYFWSHANVTKTKSKTKNSSV